MAELVRTGELKRFLPAAGRRGPAGRDSSAGRSGFERRTLTTLFADMVGFTDLSDTAGARGAVRRAERVPARDDGGRRRARRHPRQLHRRRPDGHLRRADRSEESSQAWRRCAAAFAMKARAEELTGGDPRAEGSPPTWTSGSASTPATARSASSGATSSARTRPSGSRSTSRRACKRRRSGHDAVRVPDVRPRQGPGAKPSSGSR